MFLSYERVRAIATVRTAAHLTIPANATFVELQATEQNVRYTMDNTTNPSQVVGMVLLTTEPPRRFVISDLKRIRFIRGAAADARLNLHYGSMRDV